MTLDVISGKNFELTPESITIFDWRADRRPSGWATHSPIVERDLGNYDYALLRSEIEHKLDARQREGVLTKVGRIIICPPAALFLTIINAITADNFREAKVHEHSSGYFDLPELQFGKYSYPVRVAKLPILEYRPMQAVIADHRGLPVGKMTGKLAVGP